MNDRLSIDNYPLLQPLLTFNDPRDDFYVCEILKRRKENPTMPVGTKLIDTLYLYQGDLKRKIEYIKDCCGKNNARAYLRLNKRSARSVALRAIKKLAELIEHSQYKAAKRAYASAAGEVNSAGNNKTWFVDLDYKHLPFRELIKANIEECEPKNKIILEVPTVNGVHIICKPFNRATFTIKASNPSSPLVLPQEIRSIDCHKDNPTLLFYANPNEGVDKFA